MAVTMMEVEAWVLIDADGQSWVGDAPDSLDEENDAVHPTRLLRLNLSVLKPEMAQLSAEIPAESLPNVPCKMTVQG